MGKLSDMSQNNENRVVISNVDIIALTELLMYISKFTDVADFIIDIPTGQIIIDPPIGVVISHIPGSKKIDIEEALKYPANHTVPHIKLNDFIIRQLAWGI
jgi:3-mercaptopyruvate sulfurtransferase SseA